MAYTYIWPITLPQVPQKGFSETGGVNIIRTPTDAGPAKQRRRGKRPSTLNLSFIMTTAQTTQLESFIDNTIKGASGQAIQNMNILFGLTENLGLDLKPRMI